MIIANRLAPARARDMTWNGAGGWVIFSHDRHVNFSRTVWITFHCRGTTSRVSVTSSPSLTSLPPQHGQQGGAGTAMRSRGRCAGNGARAGFQLLELQFQLVEQLAAALGRLAKLLALHFGNQQLEIGDHRLGA